ncbi:hypothetical protein NUV30_08980 [Kocuria rhizophila]|uniref:hypothetical protein n=1 Tax=Kocuria TaxID=57493 RepID=UPI00214FD85A|nr:hypothetical protein [Kocuria rhizophila]MCR4526502.1 hypothetical protein [Kocuria rhizophila]WIW68206.1 hypothetical protein P8S73_11105 [Kocuria sp. ChxB]
MEGAFEGVPTETLRAALAYLDHPDPQVRAAYLLGTVMGRQHHKESLPSLVQHVVKKSLSDQMGAPPWEENPIAGYDYPLTDAQRREMFPQRRDTEFDGRRAA